ncbi:hypothetical protein QEH52_06165 [Coraliomargarita sp. SDUM461003]|uniref:Zinc-finger domain-containing protein n=1 Tax=Thalassobacterium maritimum TaxID=3041265 RepID=A0ABU1AUZ6_9BACT|nr:hypothetical protein [Coraliomargarita sp. SDUM461003]MDQ8207084.1 hypothetical protein [Coraliomargarita sp. SDUM461003]
MSEEKFTELVNLYLDKEISERGLADLKAELLVNPQRKAAFQKRCRLHQAMRLALNPSAKNIESTILSRRSNASVSKSKGLSPRRSGSVSSGSGRSSSRRSGARSSERSARASTRGSTYSAQLQQPQQSQKPQQPHQPLPFETRHQASTFSEKGVMPRWVLGTGLAASFAIGFTLLAPAFRGGLHYAANLVQQGVASDKLSETEQLDPLDTLGRADLRRYASTQAQRSTNQRASIAAQLRLMGLRPEFTPEEKQLRSVSLAAAQRPQPTRNDAELLAGVQQMSPMPTPQILRVAADSTSHESSSRWPSGFQTSLASFK